MFNALVAQWIEYSVSARVVKVRFLSGVPYAQAQNKTSGSPWGFDMADNKGFEPLRA